MDSPVILDTASEFGRGIDLDRAFPGFPFDDVEGFGRRSSDIRSHLDDLASRHPEFADHLLGSAWGDIPAFHTGSLRNRRRGSGSNSSSSYQGHPDEDARSQASGSSATSAASGASGVSSQGDPGGLPDQQQHQQRSPSGVSGKQDTSGSRRNPIPQYGLRNTVDIGQHRHNMDNPDKVNRGQRSMSAPPENRQQDDVPLSQESMQQNSQNPNQRFVSRVDITPQFVPQQQQQQPPQPGVEKIGGKTQQSQPQQQKPQQQQPQSNVRHIPIFVEGRDEPVIPKNVDTDQTDSSWTYAKPQPTAPPQFQQPPQFQSPPQFHRPSHFNQHYGGRARDWLPNFEEEFYAPQSTFQQPGVRRTQQHQQQPTQSPPRHFRPQSQPQSDNCNRGQRGAQQEPHFAQQAHHPQQQQQPQSQQETPVVQPRKQTQPKDPLEKVAEVQQEVDALTEQVNLWNGASRKDKEYMYLDEMLTRELIKLDDIETEGKENVRQARKNAIRSIQESISLLESKAPIPGQERIATQEQQQPVVESANDADNTMQDSGVDNTETKIGENEQQAPIPLPPPTSIPPAPSSPTKEEISSLPEVEKVEVTPQEPQIQENHTNIEDQAISQDSQEIGSQPMENNAPVVKVPSVAAMEIQITPEVDNSQLQQQEQTTAQVPSVTQTTTETSMDVENQPKSPKTAKKVKKTKKHPPQQQTPISDGAIPLPAPEPHQTDTAK